jgi:hypothetical protein
LLFALLGAALLAIEVLELALVVVELLLVRGVRGGVALLLEQTFALLGELAATLLDGFEPRVRLLACLL